MPPGGVAAPRSRVSGLARSWRLAGFADPGVLLAATTYSRKPESAEPSNAERIFVLLPGIGGSVGLGFRKAPGFPFHERRNIFHLRTRKAKIKAQHPEERLM